MSNHSLDYSEKSSKSRLSADFQCLVGETGRFLFDKNDAQQVRQNFC